MARLAITIAIFWFLMRDKYFSNTSSIKLFSHYVSVNSLYWTPFLFFLFRLLFLQLDLSVFWSVWVFNFLLPSTLFWNFFFFFVLFRMLWMLVNVKKGKFPLRKTWLTLSKIPALEGMLVIVYKIEFISRKTWIIFTRFYYFLWTTLHVMFSHTKCKIAINVSHIMFSSVSELSHTRLA